MSIDTYMSVYFFIIGISIIVHGFWFAIQCFKVGYECDKRFYLLGLFVLVTCIFLTLMLSDILINKMSL